MPPDGRGALDQLVASALTFGKVPPGQTLRCEHGSSWSERWLVLVPLPDWVPTGLSPVSVPAKVRNLQPAVDLIKANPRLLPWSGPTRSRALRLLHVLCAEANRRGYDVQAVEQRQGPTRGLVVITVHGHGIEVAMRELQDRLPHTPTTAELREPERHSWVSIPPYDHVPSGRLSLEVITGGSVQQDHFADGN